jgi:3-methyladenine DNA glycosylase AlkD
MMLKPSSSQTLQLIKKELRKHRNPEKAAFFPRFFRTGKGEYGEGDKFIGITVPEQRIVAAQFKSSADETIIAELLDSEWHEERLTALFLLNFNYKRDKKKNSHKKWVDLYLKKIDRVNNWDLVDSSAPLVLGDWLLDKDRKILYDLSKEDHLWKNRIAILSTLAFIKNNDLKDTLRISEILLNHPHDLIHKAVGWMLREAQKKDAPTIEVFILKHASVMPRTMLRYAIEKWPEAKRKKLLIESSKKR